MPLTKNTTVVLQHRREIHPLIPRVRLTNIIGMMAVVVERMRSGGDAPEHDKRNHPAWSAGACTAESRLAAERKLVARLVEACPSERMTLSQIPDHWDVVRNGAQVETEPADGTSPGHAVLKVILQST